MLKKLLYIYLLFISKLSFAQKDSVQTKGLDEVVVTATRSERQMGALPMPVTLISKKQIQASGSLRLNDILQEQTGLFIVNDHGNGVQLQGFNPDYTLILIDGEPLIGRTAGTLELSRVSVGNIKQIEIVKGPSSSLYGSEALAGVINIITDSPKGIRGSLSARYGANATTDITSDVSLKTQKISLYLFGNRYQSAGYDFSPETFGQTISPFNNYTLQSKIGYEFSKKLKLNLSGRYFEEVQNSGFLVDNRKVSGDGVVKDFNFTPSLTWKTTDRWKNTFRYYTSSYQTNAILSYEKDGSSPDAKVYDESFFKQTFQRPEWQSDFTINQKNLITLGMGQVAETVEATRYEGKKNMANRYIFAQYEYFPTAKLQFIGGGRFDAHNVYRSQFSPKISAQYELNEQWAIRASGGVGYKAPDFRQLYLNFTNAVAGYSVFGSNEVQNEVEKLQKAGQITGVLTDLSQFGTIRPESSVAFNIGTKFQNRTKNMRWSVNAFRNNVKDLIETQVVAAKSNGQNVFSYLNLNQVFTQGIETDASRQFKVGSGQFSLNVGYQYLEAKDQAILDKIKEGKLFGRDTETLATKRLTKADYGGLFSRSKHSANVKLFYEIPTGGEPQSKVSTSLRAIYRSRYGFGDSNGNLILDADNEYVKGFVTLNFAAMKTFGRRSDRNVFTLQTGIDNLLNYRNKLQIPNLAGRLWYVSARINFEKKS